MAKQETILGYQIDRRSPTRVVVSKDGEELIDMRGQPGLEGDDLIKVALDRVMGRQAAPPANAHVIDVPVGTVDVAGKEV